MTKDTKVEEEIVQQNCKGCGRTPNWKYMDKFPHKKITTTTHILSGCPFIDVELVCISCIDKTETEDEKGFKNLADLFS